MQTINTSHVYPHKKIGIMIWKISNIWQGMLRNVLRKHSLTLNEFIILETLISLQKFYKIQMIKIKE